MLDDDVVDALSRLPLINSYIAESGVTREQLAGIYGVDKLDDDTFPLIYRAINKYQRKDKEMFEKLKCANHHTKYLFPAPLWS